MTNKNERVELEPKIIKYRDLARNADQLSKERIDTLIVELEQKLREIDQ